MRKSLGCLYQKADKPLPFDKLAESLDTSESPDVFHNGYDMAQQRALEEGAYDSAMEVWKYEMKEGIKRGDVFPGRLGLRGLAWDWVQAMVPILKRHIENIRPVDVNSYGEELKVSCEKETDTNRLDHIWLTALPLETLCAITIMEVIRYQTNETRSVGCKAMNLISKVGTAVEREMKAGDLVRKENKGLHPRTINLRQLFYRRRQAERYASKFHQELINGTKDGVTYWPFEWRRDVRIRVLLHLAWTDFLVRRSITLESS